MKNNPLVSIIIPVYNTEEYLEDCLDSLCNQTLKNIEIICIDDASNDNSSEILNHYVNSDDRIKLLKNKFNQGQSISRNRGLEIATGEYVTFLDSDDLMQKDAYEKLYNFANNYNHDLVVFDAVRFNDEMIEWKSVLHSKAGYDKVYTQTNVFEHKNLIYDTSISKFLKNDFIKRHNFKFLENVLYEDLLFSMQVLCASVNLGVYPDVKYYWRVRYGYKKSVTQSVSEIKNLKDRLTIINKILDLLNSNSKNKSLLNIFYQKLVEIDILQFIDQLDSCSSEYKQVMCDEVKPLVLNFPIEVFEELDGIDKVKYLLFLNDMWDDLIELIQFQKYLKNEINDLKARNRKLSNSVKIKNEKLKKQRNFKYLLEKNHQLKKENKALKKEIKIIKSTGGWLKYKVNNIYLRIFKKI
ncbi:glycosyltransferase family 2 protein [Methanobrevibacter sp.]|uniref:glycosyltransferase family 2 protein n=1 Tax=Methanobrevibacter sp. TaxID=66852 RepID=UPI00386A2D20